MKPIDEYINEVYEKYNQTEKEHQIYKTVNMKPKNSFKSICAVFCVIFAVGCVFCMKDYLSQEKQQIQYVETETREDGIKIYINKLRLDLYDTVNQIKKLIDNSEYIVVVSKEECISTDYEIKNENFLLKTENLLKVQKVLKGNLDGIQSVSCYKYGGELPLEIIEKDESINWQEWEKKYIGYELSKKEIEKGIFKQITTMGLEFEEGKQYLTFFNYDEENQNYKIFDLAYGVMEYDPLTNKVKNIDTGEFEDFDWSLITKTN